MCWSCAQHPGNQISTGTLQQLQPRLTRKGLETRIQKGLRLKNASTASASFTCRYSSSSRLRTPEVGCLSILRMSAAMPCSVHAPVQPALRLRLMTVPASGRQHRLVSTSSALPHHQAGAVCRAVIKKIAPVVLAATLALPGSLQASDQVGNFAGEFTWARTSAAWLS